MTSRWIEELEDVYCDGGEWDDMLSILERIDSLLKLAGATVVNDQLYVLIKEETQGEDEIPVKRLTGVSSVVPVTDAEAERIFREVGDREEELTED